jgi:cytochrome c-type biogenesis protein CcmH
MCPVCGVPLSIAQSPQAERERVFIRGLIARGMTKEQIKQALVVQFGRSVLALPSSEGFDLAAYLVPLLVLLALIGLLAVMLPRWRRRGRRPIAAAGPPTLPPGDRARLDDELARFDS